MALAPLLLTCVAMSVARAGEYYVSPAGSEQDDGSRGSPWAIRSPAKVATGMNCQYIQRQSDSASDHCPASQIERFGANVAVSA